LTPLFRYFFPEPVIIDGEVIDLSADEKPFYLNPYSGEMSLDFPKAERKCRGGILAYAPVSLSSKLFLLTLLCSDGNYLSRISYAFY
jgi:DNA repair protein RAD5